MKAMGFNRHGGPEVMEPVEVPDPVPGDNEVLIRLSATSVNRLDILAREGVHGMQMRMPHIPGTDIVGTVEKAGRDAKKFSEGELVISNTVYGCGMCANCKSGNDNLCAKWKCYGLQVNGSYGELISVPERLLSRPNSMYSIEELAAMPHSLSVAWRAIHTLAMAKAGETILVRGASGNTGIFSILLSKAMGLNVIAMSRSKEKSEKLKKLGANHVLDSNGSADSLKEEVMSMTNGNGADIILETFGSTLGESVGLATPSARIISFGTLLGAMSEVSIRRLYLWNVSILGMHNAGKAELDAAFEFASSHNIRPVIAKKMPIERAAEAQSSLEQAEYFGKIVLEHW